jgi:hypothetical protein
MTVCAQESRIENTIASLINSGYVDRTDFTQERYAGYAMTVRTTPRRPASKTNAFSSQLRGVNIGGYLGRGYILGVNPKEAFVALLVISFLEESIGELSVFSESTSVSTSPSVVLRLWARLRGTVFISLFELCLIL